MSDVRQTTIPFSGFYHSIHDGELDNTLHLMFSNDQGTPFSSIIERAFDLANWRQIHFDYAKMYAERFAAQFELETLQFIDLVSPKYYNYETDRIICEIDVNEVIRIFSLVDKTALENGIRQRFTSYDGFISFYPNELERWPTEVTEWDHNQIGTLLEVYVEQVRGGGFYSSVEYDLLEDGFESVNRILENNIEGIDRLYKISNYLRERESRA